MESGTWIVDLVPFLVIFTFTTLLIRRITLKRAKNKVINLEVNVPNKPEPEKPIIEVREEEETGSKEEDVQSAQSTEDPEPEPKTVEKLEKKIPEPLGNDYSELINEIRSLKSEVKTIRRILSLPLLLMVPVLIAIIIFIINLSSQSG